MKNGENVPYLKINKIADTVAKSYNSKITKVSRSLLQNNSETIAN